MLAKPTRTKVVRKLSLLMGVEGGGKGGGRREETEDMWYV
jgi:hypothetical protein